MANRSKEDYKEECARLKQRNKELEKALAFSKMETEARDMMINLAEKLFNIPIRKKTWGRTVTELVSQRNYPVAPACRLFGRCRQAYYRSKADVEKEQMRERILIDAVTNIREEDPGIGGYKLWLMLTDLFGRDAVPGRDSFFRLLRRKHLMLPPRKVRHTTNSNHRYHKWKNLIKGFVPVSANRLWVSDITYIPLGGGEIGYLHLVTDAYSHKIIGWELSDSLRASATVNALNMAIARACAMSGSDDLTGLIHHSDRGVQYCCDQYINVLRAHGISVSMTEDHNPTDNAVAERVNGIIKTERIYRERKFVNIESARGIIARYISFYNNRRPHMSIGFKTPETAHRESGKQEKKWKKKYWCPLNLLVCR